MVAIGLGNPGPGYEATRHNVGFAVVERAAVLLGVRWSRPLFKRYAVACAGEPPLCLARPLTFMNASGEVLGAVLRKCRALPGDVVVVCDSLDLPAGVCRMRLQGSSGGQRGLESIIRAAGTDRIARIVIGIGRPAERADVVPYVLSPPGGEDAIAIAGAVERCAEALLRLPREGAERLMNELNRTLSVKGSSNPA